MRAATRWPAASMALRYSDHSDAGSSLCADMRLIPLSCCARFEGSALADNCSGIASTDLRLGPVGWGLLHWIACPFLAPHEQVIALQEKPPAVLAFVFIQVDDGLLEELAAVHEGLAVH